MEENQQHLETLKEIRQMMKQSNRFLSLSGLSGVLAGIYAMSGAYFANRLISAYPHISPSLQDKAVLLKQCVFISVAVLLLSLVTAMLLSRKKALKHGERIFDHTARRLIINLFIPLFAGGIFCLALIVHGGNMLSLLSPVMLIFYGLALVNGSKYTLHDIRYLGCLEIALGLINSFYPGQGLFFWTLGFGCLHIIYGSFMWFKYERRQ
jgi:hypothetical protein